MAEETACVDAPALVLANAADTSVSLGVASESSCGDEELEVEHGSEVDKYSSE